MTPTSVQFKRGPRKYDTPLLSTSCAIILRSLRLIALKNRVPATFRSVFGLVDLWKVNFLLGLHTIRRCAPKNRIFDSFKFAIEESFEPNITGGYVVALQLVFTVHRGSKIKYIRAELPVLDRKCRGR